MVRETEQTSTKQGLIDLGSKGGDGNLFNDEDKSRKMSVLAMEEEKHILLEDEEDDGVLAVGNHPTVDIRNRRKQIYYWQSS